MNKRPKFSIYPGDYYRESISGCSLTAQGLVLRMKMVAHDSERYGYLSEDGRPMPDGTIARKCGCETVGQYADLIGELDRAKVMKRSATGIIFFEDLLLEDKFLSDNRKRVYKYRKNKDDCNVFVAPDVMAKYDNDRDIDSLGFEFESKSKTKPYPKEESLCLEIYNSYPRKTNREDALRAIKKALLRVRKDATNPCTNVDEAAVYLLQQTRMFALSPAGMNGEFTPYPATWFNKGGYADHESEWSRKGGGDGQFERIDGARREVHRRIEERALKMGN